MEAWIKRSIERNKALEKIMRSIYSADDEMKENGIDNFMFNLSGWIIKCLYKMKQRPDFPNFHNLQWNSDKSPSTIFLEEKILVPIYSFSKCKEERNYLLAQLLRKVIAITTQHFYSELQSIEILNPKKIFNTSSAMTEV
jgi:hypothetical protein